MVKKCSKFLGNVLKYLTWACNGIFLSARVDKIINTTVIFDVLMFTEVLLEKLRWEMFRGETRKKYLALVFVVVQQWEFWCRDGRNAAQKRTQLVPTSLYYF